MTRKWLIEHFEAMVDAASARKAELAKGPLMEPDLIPVVEMPSDATEWDRMYLLAQEREALGFYVTGHPLDGLDDFIKDHASCPIGEIPMGEWVTLAGVITFVEEKTTRKGMKMATIRLEDVTGGVECIFFPGSYVKVADGLIQDAVAFVSGKLDDRDGSPQFIGSRVEIPDMGAR